MKGKFFETNLPCVQVKEKDLEENYIFLGSGQESRVYEYNKDFAMKILVAPTEKKLEKIEVLSKFYDESLLFPFGFVEFLPGLKIGYMLDRVNSDLSLYDFEDVKLLYDLREKLIIIKKADRAIQRAHNTGIIIGDIKPDNILIDSDRNPRFCDMDNCKYLDEFDYDLKPDRASWLRKLYNRAFDEKDNDKFLYAILVLEILLEKPQIPLDVSAIQATLNELDDKILKSGLGEILSDSNNKPYVSQILDGINAQNVLINRPLEKKCL